ncbi:hypothetical protein [Nonomuraea guangzhouensis]|uniref:Uncharacterized protein n=1 Tax=Nonomuraea guangzhouensis TaxID=1291555 RepID=A0ABW4GQT6_9ACTN|nr:hypothetical protein [Nonomuraea guangzhouensis]
MVVLCVSDNQGSDGGARLRYHGRGQQLAAEGQPVDVDDLA